MAKYNNYSYHQIRHILQENGLKLDRIWRYKERTTHYNIVNEKNEIIAKDITLNWIRYQFTEYGYPIDYYPSPPKKRRRTILVYDKELDMLFFEKE